jgi:C-5 cytosine-specific DNA methylase
MNACNFGVPQLRPRVVFIGVREQYSEHFSWPEAEPIAPLTVGETLFDLMAANGFSAAVRPGWCEHGNSSGSSRLLPIRVLSLFCGSVQSGEFIVFVIHVAAQL